MRLIGALLAISVLAAAPPQDRGGARATPGDGKLKGKNPKAALAMAKKGMKKAGGYHVKLKVAARDQNLEYTCMVRAKEVLAKLEGAAEVYAKQHKYAAKNDAGEYVRPSEIGGEAGGSAAAAVNPQMVLLELLKSKPAAKWEADEALEEIECKVLTAEAPEKIKKMQVEMMVVKIKEAKQYGLHKRVDAKKSKSTYRVWIGKKDARIYKIAWTLEPKFNLKGLPLPPGAEDQLAGFSAAYTLELSKFGEGIEFAVPKGAAKLIK